MKAHVSIFCFIFLLHFTSSAQTEFTLDPYQSMIMTGKGPGQDGTINLFYGQDCMAIVDNIGARSFSIRVQQKGEIIKEYPIAKGETKKIKLLAGHELYLDPNPEGMAKARVDYASIPE